ncbi:MAG TPA: class I SAM-dependent methyltransferase [bacterium]|nr:class I SAM-dependent methyltransferase [bacterium]
MSYTFYSFRDRKEQDEFMWADESYEGLLKSSENRNLHRIFSRFLARPGLKIIEAGCGMGTWVTHLKRMGHDVLGVDYMDSTVQKLKAVDPEFPVQQGDVNDLAFPDSTFDAYVSLGVIEHFQEGPEKALAEAFRILKPGGMAFITVPYLSVFRRLFSHPLRELYFLIRRIRGKPKYFWEYRYTRKELKKAIEQAGFRVVHVDIDDYIPEDNVHHIGLCADFFFLRSSEELWKLNPVGRILLRCGRWISPWFFPSGIHMVAVKE